MVVLKSAMAMTMAAKTLMIRPQMASLCTYRHHLLFSPAFSSSPPLKSYAPALTLRRNCQSNNAVSRRSFCIRATTHVNDPGSIDSPLMQSMEKKVHLLRYLLHTYTHYKLDKVIISVISMIEIVS